MSLGQMAKLHFLVLLELAALLVVHQRVGESFRVFAAELLLRDRRHFAVDFHCRRKIGRDEQVGRFSFQHGTQQRVHVSQGLLLIH